MELSELPVRTRRLAARVSGSGMNVIHGDSRSAELSLVYSPGLVVYSHGRCVQFPRSAATAERGIRICSSVSSGIELYHFYADDCTHVFIYRMCMLT